MLNVFKKSTFQSITPVIAAVKSQAVSRLKKKNAAECIKLLLQSGATAKIPTSSELKKAMTLLPIETVRLLHAAGADEKALPDNYKTTVYEALGQEATTESERINLQDISRKSIRDHLTQFNKENLFITVPKLPLPKPIQSFLLHDMDSGWKIV